MSKGTHVTLLALLLSMAGACDSGGTVDAPTHDGGPDAPALDGGPPDAGSRDTAADSTPDDSPLDGGSPDGGSPDGGSPDGGSPDAGALDLDADLFDGGEPDGGVDPDVGTADGGPVDAEVLDDGGLSDAGMPDAGISDAGMPDGGMPDGGMSDGGMSDAGPSVVVLANGDDLTACGEYGGSIWPVIPGELGHYAGTRLTPPSYPFVVDRVAYDLYGFFGRQCDESFAHEVRVFVSSAARPPARPTAGTPVTTIAVPAGDPDDHTVELDLPEPLRLEAGEHLYVAVQMAGDATRSLCMGVCQVFSPVEGVDFWSNAASEPYSWGDMVVDYGFLSNYTIRAYGHPR